MIYKALEMDSCFGCGSCKQKCPFGAITMIRDEYGFLIPQIDDKKCTKCGLCKKSCPALNAKKVKNYEISEAYTVKAYNSQNSASGGAFYQLAQKVLNNGGYIAGTIWNNEFLPEIILSNKYSDLERMCGSKYVNGGTGNSYNETLTKLNEGYTILYSGTPCQIAGLYSFLGQDYDNLITVEILCHGGGSPLAWSKYIEFAQTKYNKKIIDIKIQNAKGKFNIYFQDGSNIVEDINKENEYVPVYLEGKIKRLCCDVCPFMSRKRNADIIIGDVWAKWAAKYRKNGISLLIPNSEKGKNLFKDITWEFCNKFDINSQKNAPLNKINNNIPIQHPERKNFLDNLVKNKNYSEAIKNKKVGLFNFNYPRDNYGALLIAYAMETIVRKLGYEPYTINYYKYVDMNYNPQGPTWKFREKYLNLYGFYYNKGDLYPLNNIFNIFIFGSDIIWEQIRDYVYFADWCIGKKKLIAYAASFRTKSMPKKDEYKKMCMQRFDSVSVREISGIDICKKYANIDAQVCIDPTLLLSPENYQKIIDEDNSEIPSKRYIGYYTFYKFSPYNVKTDLPLYDIFHDKNNKTRTFGQWLNMIKNAKCIITSSFHGVCFSVLYNVPFIYILKPQDDNERVYSLFKLLEIDEDCIVHSEEEITDDLINKNFDWSKINANRIKWRNSSIEWLREALEVKYTYKNSISEQAHYVINIFGIKIKIRKEKIIKKISKILSCWILKSSKRKRFREMCKNNLEEIL